MPDVQLNGAPHTLPDGTDLAAVVAGLAAGPRGIAVAVNGCVVPRDRWPGTVLRAGDRVEVLSASQGG